MNRKLAKDLAAWEDGMLSADELVARHPSQTAEVRRLTGLFTEMRSLAEAPVPDPTKGWNEVRSRIAEHIHVARQPVSLLDRLSPRLQRRLAIGMAAALLVVPPVAMAATDAPGWDEFTVVLGELDDAIFGAPEPTLNQAEGGSTPQFDVGEGESTPSLPQVPSGTGKVAPAPETGDISGGSLAGADGGNVSTINGSSQEAPRSGSSGAAGTDGGSGQGGSSASGADGESEDGADAKGADATPSPSPSPTLSQATPGSAPSASSPSVP